MLGGQTRACRHGFHRAVESVDESYKSSFSLLPERGPGKTPNGFLVERSGPRELGRQRSAPTVCGLLIEAGPAYELREL